MEKFKIVQMLPALGWGGAQVFCLQLCNELAKHPDYDVTLVSMYHYDQDNHLPLDMLSKQVKFVTIGKRKGIDPRVSLRIYKTLKRLDPDVVHTHLHAVYYCFLAYLFIKDNIFNKIHTLHNLVKHDAPWYGRLALKIFFKKSIMQPVSISDEVHKSALYEYTNCNIIQINNGSYQVKPSPAFEKVKTVIQQLKKNNTTKVIVNVARITKQKNQQLLIECMKILERDDENVIALIVGGYLEENKKLYDELTRYKPGNVHFIGKVTNVGDYLLNADAFLLPSLYEGLPISLLEAMSAGVVPICTPVGGILNIVKPDIGFLSKDLSTESYLAAIKAFLHSDSATIEKLKANCRAVYKNEFSMESCVAKYDKLYHNQNNVV
jgi:glycosyltransferase involved in cell wall biosynthesis